MDYTEDDGWHPPNPFGLSVGHESLNSQRIQQNVGSYYDDDDEEDTDGENAYDVGENADDVGENANDVGENADDVGENGEQDYDNDDDGQKHPKKRKMRSLLSSYEFAPRLPMLSIAGSVPKPAIGGRNSLSDWTEHESFILLDAWGDKFLQHGRKSLRSDEWQQVAEKVSQESKVERSDTQCRNRLDTLKKKYKKEKLKIQDDRNQISKWVYFKKLDMLLSTPPHQVGFSCGVDSGEYVFMSPKAPRNHANGYYETRDNPGTIIPVEEEDSDSEGLPPKKARNGRNRGLGASLKLLADSIQKFVNVYEKTENNKSQQLLELEKMRMDFYKEVELQKRQILERMKAEIAIIRQGHDEEDDASSTENVSI